MVRTEVAAKPVALIVPSVASSFPTVNSVVVLS
jgi:hypothetical protein